MSSIRNFIKAFVYFTPSEKRGIIILSFLIICVLLIYRLILPGLDFNTQPTDDELIAQARVWFDSIENAQNPEKPIEITLFRFNPNTISESDALKLGFSKPLANNLVKYREAGGVFKVAEDLKKLYLVDDSVFGLYKEYISIPSQVKAASKPPATIAKKIRLNQSDSADWVQLPGLTPWMAARIIKYRQLLGGYCQSNQLLEVYGMDSTRFTKLLPLLIPDTNDIEPIAINHATYTQLIRHPYISKQLTLSILEVRRHKKISSWDDLLLRITINEKEAQNLKAYFVFD